MSPPPIRFDTEELLAQLGWVRSLARRVASDAHGAEDLTQEAMLVALRGGASAPVGDFSELGRTQSLRRWLAAVVRNLGRTNRRSGRRRAVREAAVVDTQVSPSTLELLERAATHRELVGALLELGEPYRTTLLLRFFEDRSQREIAERMGVPVSTVSTRIAEGVARLRRNFPARERWLASVLPSIGWPRKAAIPALSSGAVLMSVQAKLAFAAVILVGGLIGIQSLDQGSSIALEVAAETKQPQADLALADVQVGLERQLVESLPEPAVQPATFHDIPEHAAVVRTIVRVRGRVIDLNGAPVAGVEILIRRPGGMPRALEQAGDSNSAVRLLSDAAGRFEAEGAIPYTLSVHDSRYATLYEAVIGPEIRGANTEDALILVALQIPIAGIVIDEQGAPIENVQVSRHANISRPGLDLSALSLVMPSVSSDEMGAFEFEDAPGIDPSMLEFQASGYARKLVPVPVIGDAAMSVVLGRENESTYLITGRVVLEDGNPAVGAHVSTGGMSVTADEQGNFVLDLEPMMAFIPDKSLPVELTAVRKGLLPASLTLPSVQAARESGWPKNLVLELSGEPFSVRGIVVDEEGRPVPGVLVEPLKPSPFGVVSASGQSGLYGRPMSQEAMVGGGEATTDAEGRFELKGLLDRSYALRVLSRASVLSVTTDPIQAGTQNARIVLDQRGLGSLVGRIHDRHGEGIAGVRVAVSLKRISELVIGTSAVTDGDGRFRIEGVSTDPEYLRIEGASIVPELFRKLAEGADPANLELEVGRRCRLQFDWGDWPKRDDEIQVLDAQGKPLMMMRLSGNSIGEIPTIKYRAIVSDVALVSDAAAHAVILRDGEEVMRLPLNLVGDELNLIQL